MIKLKDYYSKVVSDLTNYREYKHRCAVIKIELDGIIENNQGVSYNGAKVQNNSFHSSTETAVIKRNDSNLQKELNKKEKKIKKVNEAYEGLDPLEQFIVKKKYMTGRIVKDVNIYTHPEWESGRTKYYEKKDDAVAKLARILGYLEEK